MLCGKVIQAQYKNKYAMLAFMLLQIYYKCKFILMYSILKHIQW